MINITVEAKEFKAIGAYGSVISLEIELRESELDTEEIAECVSIEKFFDTHDEDEIKSYVKKNYDWFD